jgi:lipoate-protein ligase A
VVGRFQDVTAEVDVDFCQHNDIQIGRRFTGGGAVFQDEGNLNITIVTQRQRETLLSQFYETNCRAISNVLNELGAKSRFVPPNSIEIAGRKVSGSAAALSRDFALWHASLLVSTNEQMLSDALRPSQAFRKSEFIRSRWQPVITLNEALRRDVDIERVKRLLIGSCETCFHMETEVGELALEEKRVMNSLYERKYSSSEWNIRGHCWNIDMERKEGGTHTTIAV